MGGVSKICLNKGARESERRSVHLIPDLNAILDWKREKSLEIEIKSAPPSINEQKGEVIKS